MSIARRARLHEVGFDRPLTVEPFGELPTPEADQVLIAIEAAGVCHRDLLDRAGRFPFQVTPITPGHETAGRVIAIGPDVCDFVVGDRVGTMHRNACGECAACAAGQTSLCDRAAFVLGILADGGYATHLVAPQSGLFSLPGPDELGAAEAAVLHCAVGTAWRDLHTLGKLQPGERFLVTGANGGVGSAAIPLARRLGAAEVIAVVRHARHADFCRAQGAHTVVVDPGNQFHSNPTVGRVDLVLDTVGQPTFQSALRSLRVGGRVVVVGNIVPEKVPLNLGFLITYGLTVIGGNGATRKEMAEVAALHRAAPLPVPIAQRFPLEEAEAAQQAVRAGGLEGRVVLVP